MATLPKEQVTQRNKTGDVSITFNRADDSPGEKLWLSTTTEPYTVVNTKSVVSNQEDRTELEDRIVAAGEALYVDYDLYTEEGIGYDSNSQPLVIIGDGDEAMAVANSDTETLDISDFVTGGYAPLTYALDASSVIDLTDASASMVGSVLQYTSGAVDGTDVAVVNVTDRDGTQVQITVTITVA